MTTLHAVLAIAGALVAGAVVGLKVIAPMTATKTDDEVLARLEALEELLKKLAV